MQRKPPKGKSQAAENPTNQSNAPVTQESVGVDATQEAAVDNINQETVMVYATQEAVVIDASQAMDVQASQVVDASQAMDIQASQIVDATQDDPVSKDFFEDISDYDMLTVEEMIAVDIRKTLDKRCEEEKLQAEQSNVKEGQDKLKAVKIEKVKAVKKKYMGGTKLYHGKQRRSSERINAKCLSKPIVGVGSSQTQPIVIKETDEDSAKLGTCFRSMKSWNNLTKKK
jgi:hypothetical protein